jgi:regulator of RNase E activity RraA
MAEIEGINQGSAGDVLVIQGVHGVSNMGGIIATIANRQGFAGAIVDGGVRDVAHSRALGFPVWSQGVTPVTGKWRVVTQEINAPVSIAGVVVNPGDLIVADETGVCCVPTALIVEALEACEQLSEIEAGYEDLIASGLSVPELTQRFYGST